SIVIASTNEAALGNFHAVYKHIKPVIVARVILLTLCLGLFSDKIPISRRNRDELQILDVAWTAGFLSFICKRDRKVFLLGTNRCPVLMYTCYGQEVASSVPHDADMNFAPLQLFQLTLDAGHVLAE